jgi:hypothetical protein
MATSNTPMESAAAPTASQACPRASLFRPTVKTLIEKPVYLLDGGRLLNVFAGMGCVSGGSTPETTCKVAPIAAWSDGLPRGAVDRSGRVRR